MKEEEEHHTEEPFAEEEQPSRLRRIYIAVLAIFLLVLIIPYFLSAYGIDDIFRGMIESSTFQGSNIIQKDKDSQVIFEKKTKKELDQVYEENKEKEFKLCLIGEKKGNNYHIYSIHRPTMYKQLHNQVVSDPCPAETIISLHSHPEKKCLASQQDIKSLNYLKTKTPDALMAVMCEDNRLNFYS